MWGYSIDMVAIGAAVLSMLGAVVQMMLNRKLEEERGRIRGEIETSLERTKGQIRREIEAELQLNAHRLRIVGEIELRINDRSFETLKDARSSLRLSLDLVRKYASLATADPAAALDLYAKSVEAMQRAQAATAVVPEPYYSDVDNVHEALKKVLDKCESQGDASTELDELKAAVAKGSAAFKNWNERLWQDQSDLRDSTRRKIA